MKNKIICLALLGFLITPLLANAYSLKGLIENVQFLANSKGNNLDYCYIAINDSNSYYSKGYHFASKDMCFMAQTAFIYGLEVRAIGAVTSSAPGYTNEFTNLYYANKQAFWPGATYAEHKTEPN